MQSLLLPTSYAQQGFSFSYNESQTNNVKSLREDEVINVGDASSPYGSYNFPVDFYGKTSLSQCIYTQEEINHAPFVITQLQYTYKTVNPNITQDPIEGEEFRVWLCNTTQSSLAEEAGWWVPYEEFTLVFEGPLSLPAGVGQHMTFALSSPYVYNGGNLCIMVERKLSANEYPNHFNFIASSTDENDKRGRVYWSLDTPIDLENMITDPNYHGMTLGHIADVELFINNTTGTSLSGTVTVASTSAPLEGAQVEMLNTDLVTYTNAQGQYDFPVLNPGNQTVKVSAFGYISQEVALDLNGDMTQDFAMELLPHATVSGKVVDKDNNPLDNANIIITGYESYSAVTDANGMFTVADVLFADNYTIVTSRHHYLNDTTIFNVTEANTVLDDIVLADFIRGASLVKAEVGADNNVCNLSWLSPYDIVDYKIDGGDCWNGIGHINGEIAVMGNVFREPAQLYKASWFRYSSKKDAPADSVNLFVFPLNAQQEPINQPVFIKKVFSAYNTWTDYVFEDTLDMENGFMVALSGLPVELSLGVDSGLNPDYPFLPNVNYASENYLLDDGAFFPIENVQPLPGNLMVRAEGYNTTTGKQLRNVVADNRTINKYKVYRLVEGTQNDPSQWTLLNDNVTELTYADNDWAGLDNDWYRYAVKAVYSDDQEAEAAFSNLLDKGLKTAVTIEVTTNTTDNSEGAKVMLSNTSNYDYTYIGFVSNADGTIVFDDVMKGTYNITIELEGYTSIFDQGVDFSTEDTYSKSYELIEALTKPSNLEVTVDDEVVFYWNVTQTISESFESYGNFAINPTGHVNWTYLDLDGNPTTTFGGIYFQNQGEPSAFMVFTPEATQPPIDLTQFPGMSPHSGSSYLMGFGYPNSTNNDFIISPELNFSDDFTFSFFAKSFSLDNLPTFQVGYSTTGNNADDFEWLTDSPVSPIGGIEYTRYSYTVPKDAKYVCINNISEGEKILMIDDITISGGSKTNRSLEKYKVYLDGVFLAETTDLSYVFDVIDTQTTATYEAGVEAVYSTGTSERATITFTINEGVEDINAQDIAIYPVPANNVVQIAGAEFNTYCIYDITGKLVATNNLLDAQIDVSRLENGMYTIKLMNNDKVVTRKIIVKH